MSNYLSRNFNYCTFSQDTLNRILNKHDLINKKIFYIWGTSLELISYALFSLFTLYFLVKTVKFGFDKKGTTGKKKENLILS